MHPSQMSPFRKTLLWLLAIAFGGSLMIYTGMQNLELLKSVNDDPNFYMFGLLALEGGIVFWTGYYLLHPSGRHKGMSVFAIVVDSIMSGTGFFYNMERITHAVGTFALPPVIVVIWFAVVFNIAFIMLCKLIPSPSADFPTYAEQARLERPRNEGPNPFLVMGQGAVASLQNKAEQAIETHNQRKQARTLAKQAQITTPEIETD